MRRLGLALGLGAAMAAAFAIALESQSAAGSSSPRRAEHNHAANAKQERYLYVTTLAKSADDPDFIAVIGADPRYADFGRIVNRVDMPKAGDELHHFGYSPDQKRLIVPGLFSNRVHVFDVKGGGKSLRLRARERGSRSRQRLRRPARRHGDAREGHRPDDRSRNRLDDAGRPRRARR